MRGNVRNLALTAHTTDSELIMYLSVDEEQNPRYLQRSESSDVRLRDIQGHNGVTRKVQT